MVDFEVLKRVHVCLCNIWSPLTVVSSICQVCGSRQPQCLGWIQMSLTATQLSSIFYFERSWNSFKSLFHNTVVAFDPSWLRSLNNPLLCGLSSFSVSVFAPYSSLCPQGQPLFKERAFEQFAPSLPHYFTRSLRGGHHLVFITQQVNLHHAILCVPSLVQTVIQQDKKRSAPPLSTDKTVTILCKEWFWGTDIILSSYSTLKSPIFVQNI